MSLPLTLLFSLVFHFQTQQATAAEIAPHPARVMVLKLAELMSEEGKNSRGKIPYRKARMIEVLLYRAHQIEVAFDKKKEFHYDYRNKSLEYNPEKTELSYHWKSQTLAVQKIDASLEWNVIGSKKVPPGKLALGDAKTDSLAQTENQIYDLILNSRGYQTQNLQGDSPSLVAAHKGDKEFNLDINEKWITGDDFAQSKWEYTPVKLVSWALQKAAYDLPNAITSIAVESVTRSPLHNIQGAGDELIGAAKLAVNAFKDMGRGIVRPKRAAFADGVFELLDVGFKLGNSSLGVVKSAVSVAAYPLYRLFGGKKSIRIPIRGKRAVIVLIDSQMGGIVDSFGEMIVRSKLKGISDFVCFESVMHDQSASECIEKLPASIQYLDIVSLQHSGGMDVAEFLAEEAAAKKNIRPELLLSIGCYDDPSHFVEGENTLGQKKTSWAVHYYFANLLEKRLRGIPIEQASKEAFNEGLVSNAIDPVSWAAVLTIGLAMEDKLIDGYKGSEPSLITTDSIVLDTLAKFTEQKAKREVRQKYAQEIERLLSEKKIQLKEETRVSVKNQCR